MDNHKERVLNLIDQKIDSNNSERTDNSILSDKLSSLIEYEFRIISFISALYSYRRDSLLRPFPNDFLDSNNVKNFNKLIELVKEIPSIIHTHSNVNLSNDCWKLLNWIFTYNSIELKLLNNQEVKDLYCSLKLNDQKSQRVLPNYVFKLTKPNGRIRFNRLKNENGVFKCFHGTKLENLWSIVHNGLVNNLNKRDVFGQGTYLSKSLEVAITFSPYAYVESNCLIKRLSCIFLCDVVKDPSINVKENEAYCLVKDDDLVDVTHIFVYGQIDTNQKRAFPKYELLFLFLGLVLVLYSVYKSNNRH